MQKVSVTVAVLVVLGGIACQNQDVGNDRLSRNLVPASSSDTTDLALAPSGRLTQQVVSAIEQVPYKHVEHAPVQRLPQTPPPLVGIPQVVMLPVVAAPDPAPVPVMTAPQLRPVDVSPSVPATAINTVPASGGSKEGRSSGGGQPRPARGWGSALRQSFAGAGSFLRTGVATGNFGGVTVGVNLNRGIANRGVIRRAVEIRVSQETSPGAGDFNVLGLVSALNIDGTAAAFYMYGVRGPNYGNSSPNLTANTSHLFFVNSSEGLALFVIHNTSNRPEISSGGSAETRFDLLSGTARILLSDDPGEATSNDGTIFTGSHHWERENTDGMVIGALPVGSTIFGQFTSPPSGLDGGWEVVSSYGSTIPLHLVPGQRVRLDII